MVKMRHEKGWGRGKKKIRHVLSYKKQREDQIKKQIADESEPTYETALTKTGATAYVETFGVLPATLSDALNAGQVPRSEKQGIRWQISPSGLDEWLISIGVTP